MRHTASTITENRRKANFFAPSALLILVAAMAFGAGAQDMNITQVDSARLLATQEVRLFVNLPGSERGRAPEEKDIEVWESADGKTYAQRPIRKVSLSENKDEGISFFFLLDNSGSMWDDIDGKPTQNVADMRISHARDAIKNFIAQLSPLDRVGLAVFNTRFWLIQDTASDPKRILSALDEIKRPSKDDAYTELYGSVDRALRNFAEPGRRRVLVVLSDGENFPYFVKTGKANPDFGVNVTKSSQASSTADTEGISCYAVRFGNEKDRELALMALASGGSVFDARDKDELLAVYNSIKTDVQAELAVHYVAGMKRGEKRYVKLQVKASNGSVMESSRSYFVGTVFGSSPARPRWYYLLFIAIPALAWLFFLVFKLERETSEASIRLLYGFKDAKTKIFRLEGERTVIGGDATADITIAGNPSLKGSHATILFDESKNSYTVAGGGDLTVNNKPVRAKRLEPGDVINMAGTVVVFDDAIAGTPTGTAAKPRKGAAANPPKRPTSRG